MELHEIKRVVESSISKRIFYHSDCTMKKCEKFARVYRVDLEKARRIGLAHDIAKEMKDDEVLNFCIQNQIPINDVEYSKPGLLHGKVGSVICKQKFGFSEDMCSAIECHTTAKTNMTMLEKILYIADGVGIDRKYAGVNELRKLAMTNIDKAIFTMIESVLKDCLRKGKMLHVDSIMCHNELVLKLQKG
jgi:nicotinate-nucleotide adenylyltransferase